MQTQNNPVKDQGTMVKPMVNAGTLIDSDFESLNDWKTLNRSSSKPKLVNKVTYVSQMKPNFDDGSNASYQVSHRYEQVEKSPVKLFIDDPKSLHATTRRKAHERR
mgnify:FL=1